MYWALTRDTGRLPCVKFKQAGPTVWAWQQLSARMLRECNVLQARYRAHARDSALVNYLSKVDLSEKLFI